MKTPTTFRRHTVKIPKDDGGEITFRWHFPRGTLQQRMSALELAEFLVPHMPHVLPFFQAHPRVYREFETMFLMLATQPQHVIDRIVPWIRAAVRESDFDVVVLSLFSQKTQPPGKVYSLP